MKKNFFKHHYSKCWKFALESKWFVVFAFGVFALTFLIGLAWPMFFREEIFAILVELKAEIEGMGTWDLVGFIFWNNLKASFFAMVFGIFFGIFPLFACVMNGYLLGFVGNMSVVEEGVWSLWRVLPHGVFELPAVLFSMGIGMKLGLSVFNNKVLYNLKEGLRFFVFVVFPLLVVAAVVEGIFIGVGV